MCRAKPLQHSLAGSHADGGTCVTVCASLAGETFVKQSCGNDGAMESQHQAFHSSLEISQKTRDFHIPTAPAAVVFKENRRLKIAKPETVYTKIFTPPLATASVQPTISVYGDPCGGISSE